MNFMNKDFEIENYLKNLGLNWIAIAEAMSDENYSKTMELLGKKPQITKNDFLKIMGIEEIG